MLRHGFAPVAAGPWSVEPVALALVLVTAILYARGVRRIRHPRWRIAAFLLGLCAAYLAVASPLAYYADDAFVVHMAQHLALSLVAAPLLLLGAPLRPLLVGAPRWARRPLLRPLSRSRAVRGLARIVTSPLVGAGAYLVVISLWHVPALYDRALTVPLLHQLQHASVFGAALLFWSQLIDPAPWRAALPYGARILYIVFAGVPHHVAIGTVLLFSTKPLYAASGAVANPLGLDPVLDQQLGGGLMLASNSLVSLAAVLVLVVLWLREEERKGLAFDRDFAARS